ncbi:MULTISPECIES: DUF397 domain-containing protein [unclassified Streptomyces]|jgi:hypothetical protein|uniref:DUF397 domain-containing protein n=1 Tax=Streptomyces sp. NPDC056956 TaxID=3345980 RepID=UPI003638B731
MTDRTAAHATPMSGWRKSSYSGNEAGSCLEVLDGAPEGIPVRDSKVTHGPVLVFPGTAWAAFVTHLKN